MSKLIRRYATVLIIVGIIIISVTTMWAIAAFSLDRNTSVSWTVTSSNPPSTGNVTISYNNTPLQDGYTFNIGSVTQGTSSTIALHVSNTSDTAVTVNLTVTGANSNLINAPSSTVVNANTSSDIIISLNTSTAGTYNGALAIHIQ